MRRILGILIVLAAGCRQDSSGLSAAGVSLGGEPPAAMVLPGATGGRTLPEVVAQIQRCRTRRQYADLERWLVPARRSTTTILLRAVDRLMDANRRVQRAAAARFGQDAASPWDLSEVRDNLGLLSERSRLVRWEEHDTWAEVVIQEADRLPLRYERFEQQDGLWLYAAPQVEPPLIKSLEKLILVVDSITDRLSDPAFGVDDMDRAFRHRAGPLIFSVSARDADDGAEPGG